jgi:hypothetical protein
VRYRAGDANLFRALTLLVAVCEQALLELERCDPDPELAECLTAARDAAHRALSSSRFGAPRTSSPTGSDATGPP